MKTPPPKKMPKCKNHAHHIVAGGDPRAEIARKKLKEFDIDINDKENGVFLPGCEADKADIEEVKDMSPHANVHTNDYFNAVNELLEEADSEEEIVKTLNKIGKDLQDGTFKY